MLFLLLDLSPHQVHFLSLNPLASIDEFLRRAGGFDFRSLNHSFQQSEQPVHLPSTDVVVTLKQPVVPAGNRQAIRVVLSMS